jgi:hypothetical protein
VVFQTDVQRVAGNQDHFRKKLWTDRPQIPSFPMHQERIGPKKPVLPTGPGAATVDRAKARMCEAARPRTKTLPKTMTDLMPRSVFSFSALLRDQIHKKENHAP